MSYTILWDHLKIKQKVEKMFNFDTRHRKRVILTNYLDEVLPSLLPDVHNVDIFCYPQPGNIDPYALENLEKRGAMIYFTNPINTNIFYVENEGILIGSANYNYTKNVINCHEKVKDVMVYINNLSNIDINIILTSLDKIKMNQSDLIKFKEEHHIFWKIFDGFDDIIKSFVHRKNSIELAEQCVKTSNIVNNILNIIKKIIPIRKAKKRSENKIDDNTFNNFKYGIKDINDVEKNKNALNVYCVSKDDLYEMVSSQLKMSKLMLMKKKLH